MRASAKAGIVRLGLLIGAAVGVLALTATPALALHTHPLKETFGSANQPTFKEAAALAVDPATGDLLVIDEAALTISRWKPNGEPAPFTALGTNVIDAKKGASGKACAEEASSCDATPQNVFAFSPELRIAVAPPGSAGGTGGDIYVPQGSKHLLDVFAADGHFLGQLKKAGEVSFADPWVATVDDAGNLYVAGGVNFSPEQTIFKFTPTANPPKNTDVVPPKFEFPGAYRGVAGRGPTEGYLFTPGIDPVGSRFAVAKRDATSGAIQYYFHPPGENFDPGVTAVDPANGRFFGAAGDQLEEYDASGASSATLLTTTQTPLGPFGGHTYFTGVAVDGPSGDIYTDHIQFASASETSQIFVYSPAVTIFPDVVMPGTERPTVGATTATLHGTVNPDGAALTDCHFEYDTTLYQDEEPPPHGTSVPCAETPAEIGSGSSPVAVHAELSGLKPGTNYHLALRAENAEGHVSAVGRFTGVGGNGARFTTLTPALTKPATEVKGTTATLNAEVNPFGTQLTECRFEYGPTTAYGQTAPCDETPAEIGSGSSFVPVHAHLTGLTPGGAAYHFRIVAVSPSPPTGYGTFNGKDESFATASTFSLASGEATAVGATAATLNGTVNPGGEAVTECAFEYGATTAYGHTAPCAETPAAIGSGESPVPVHLQLSGLAIGSEYHFRLIAADAGGSGHGADKAFRTLGPVIDDQWAAGVVHTEATLKAVVNPGGAATTFQVEYGETSAYGQITPPSGAGSDSSPHTLSALLEGLTPGATYHYRFTATSHCEAAHPANECTAVGPDRTFFTYPNSTPTAECPNQALRSAAYLPDCRAYEMVSPPEKNGADIIGAAVPGMALGAFEQAASDGERITYSAGAAFGDEESSVSANQYLSTRTAAGWSTHGINPLAEDNIFSAQGYCFDYNLDSPFQAFSEDLSSAWVLNSNEVPLAQGAPEGFGDLYRRDNSAGSYEALTIGEPSFASQCGGAGLGAEFRGASADLFAQFFDALAKLTPDAAATANRQAYDLAGGQLHLVSILPDGSAAATDAVVGTHTGNIGADSNNARTATVKGAVSKNGSRVYWSAATGFLLARLYLRENPAQPQSAIAAGHCTEAAKACTIPVSGSGQVTFWAANPSASEAIYSEGEGLYRFDLATESSTLIAGEAAGLVGASEDLSRLYFVSREALAEGATVGGENLYLDHEGALSFIAALSHMDVSGANGSHSFDGPAAARIEPFWHDTRVSPDGRHLVFLSDRSLTGYDNTDPASGKADEEVYIYEAGGELHCASCNPSGARPPAGALMPRPYELGGPTEMTNVPAAAWIPTWDHELHAPNVLSADGSHVFFNSFDALLPTDTNGAQDVYEWEAPGTEGPGGCHESDSDYFARDGGCISLISSGQSPRNSQFVDASADGRDVFIRTASGFDPRDEGLLDIYDARVNGGFALPSPPAACEGEACQSPPEAPNDPTPASSTFEGAGNVVEEPASPCAKGKVRRKGRCVAKKHQRAKRHHRRANHNQRAAR